MVSKKVDLIMAALAALYAVCVYARSLCASVFNRGEEGALFECVTDKIHDERERELRRDARKRPQ